MPIISIEIMKILDERENMILAVLQINILLLINMDRKMKKLMVKVSFWQS